MIHKSTLSRVVHGAAGLTLAVASFAAQALTPLEQSNKDTVLAFYNAALVQQDVDKAVQYLGAQYIQHNPMAPDGADGLKGLIKFLKEKYPQRSSNIKRVIVEGNLVVLHVHSKPTPEDRGTAIVDIFRVEGGKIVEHWDVMQPVPEKAANNNTMF